LRLGNCICFLKRYSGSLWGKEDKVGPDHNKGLSQYIMKQKFLNENEGGRPAAMKQGTGTATVINISCGNLGCLGI
jgi:hypothetical protein